ncbi:YlzJ-like protein [Moorella glycerini]|nr:YlzJ-like family protein [Moorella glycerini]CEP66809.1 YlzJ-like protein [Moorella glycerini]
MYIYSPMPWELIWEGAENFCPRRQEIKVGHLTLEIEPLSFNQARVVRLISTNPADYLAGPYQPGAVLEFAPPERL